MRLSKYTKSPIDYFLEQPIGDFYDWVKTMNREIGLECQMQKMAAAAAKAKRR